MTKPIVIFMVMVGQAGLAQADSLQIIRDEFAAITLQVSEKILQNYSDEYALNEGLRELMVSRAQANRSQQKVDQLAGQIVAGKRDRIQYRRDIPVYEKEIVAQQKLQAELTAQRGQLLEELQIIESALTAPEVELGKKEKQLQTMRENGNAGADEFEQVVVEPLRQQVEGLRQQRDQKSLAIDRTNRQLAEAEARQEELTQWIDFRKSRIVELEGDENSPGLLAVWEEQELPALQVIASKARQTVVVKEENAELLANIADASFADGQQLQELQNAKRMELYEAFAEL